MTYGWPWWLKLGCVLAFIGIMAGLKGALGFMFDNVRIEVGLIVCLALAAGFILIGVAIDRRDKPEQY